MMFADLYRYLSYFFNFLSNYSSWQSIIELCEIRDGLPSCEALSNDDVCKLI